MKRYTHTFEVVGDDGEIVGTFTAKLKRDSVRVYGKIRLWQQEIAEIEQKQTAEYYEQMTKKAALEIKKLSKTKQYKEASEEERKKLEDATRKKWLLDYSDKLNEQRVAGTLSHLRELIDRSSITEEQRELIDSEITSDFWQDQNIEEATETVARFRTRQNPSRVAVNRVYT